MKFRNKKFLPLSRFPMVFIGLSLTLLGVGQVIPHSKQKFFGSRQVLLREESSFGWPLRIVTTGTIRQSGIRRDFWTFSIPGGLALVVLSCTYFASMRQIVGVLQKTGLQFSLLSLMLLLSLFPFAFLFLHIQEYLWNRFPEIVLNLPNLTSSDFVTQAFFKLLAFQVVASYFLSLGILLKRILEEKMKENDENPR